MKKKKQKAKAKKPTAKKKLPSMMSWITKKVKVKIGEYTMFGSDNPFTMKKAR